MILEFHKLLKIEKLVMTENNLDKLVPFDEININKNLQLNNSNLVQLNEAYRKVKLCESQMNIERIRNEI